ncbi:MAG: LuxR C-terminal-related transcriptional regulator [Bacteroidales bacterium]
MKGNRHRVVIIAEPSAILFEGLSALLQQQCANITLSRVNDPEEITMLPEGEHPGLVIMNPGLIANRLKMFRALKKGCPKTRWLALVYGYFPSEQLALFDGVIDIGITGADLLKLVESHLMVEQSSDEASGQISERETEVLLLLVQGLQNKEIADKLNISIHTVISHRKNLTQKTGIRSQAGLVIYALSNKLVPIEALKR